MTNLLVVTFSNQEDGRRALADLRSVQRSGAVTIQDAEVVERDPDGKLHHVSQVDTTTKTGILGGGVLGLLLGIAFFPVLGLAVGAMAGGLIGKSIGDNIDRKLVADVTEDLKPGTSALFTLVAGSGAALVGVFAPYDFKIYQTSVDPELERQLTEHLGHTTG